MKRRGFTIVELLVVIVVIGILAAITIVSYAGITKRAVVSSLQSDLNNASTQLKLDQTINGTYPATLAAANSGKGILASSGNSYSDFQVDNTTNPPAFCLTSVNTNGTSYRITNDNSSTVGNCSRSSCLAILNAGESTGDGTYWIKPAGTSLRVYCDMSGGGWTRLNNNVASSTKPFDSNDVLMTNNVPGTCGTPGCAFTLSSILVNYANVRLELTRTTSIVQCAGIQGVSTSTAYWDGSNWISRGMCTWSDGIFANAIATDMTGLKLLWKIEGPKAANGLIQFISQCSDGSDSGQIQTTVWVK